MSSQFSQLLLDIFTSTGNRKLYQEQIHYLDSLPSSVEKPEWIVKATLVRKMLECEKSSIAEP